MSFDHAAIIAFIDSIWNLINYGNIVYYGVNLICCILLWNVMRGIGVDDDDIADEADLTIDVSE
jgi:hypothetical protein